MVSNLSTRRKQLRKSPCSISGPSRTIMWLSPPTQACPWSKTTCKMFNRNLATLRTRPWQLSRRRARQPVGGTARAVTCEPRTPSSPKTIIGRLIQAISLRGLRGPLQLASITALAAKVLSPTMSTQCNVSLTHTHKSAGLSRSTRMDLTSRTAPSETRSSRVTRSYLAHQ